MGLLQLAGSGCLDGGQTPGGNTGLLPAGDSARFPERIQPGGWFPANRRAIEDWLSEKSRFPNEGPRVAVFDWDNTCIYGDISDACFRYLVDNLTLRLTPEMLAELLPTSVDGVEILRSGIRLSDVRRDLLCAYSRLWPHIQAGDPTAARALPAHRDFRAKAGWLYEQLAETEGIGTRAAYVWAAGWFAGFRLEEIPRLVDDALGMCRDAAPGRGRFTSASEGRSGIQGWSYPRHLVAHEEMRDLFFVLQRSGFSVTIVSASLEVLVEAAAQALGFPVGTDAVFGLRSELSGDRLTTRLLPEEQYPVTYRGGKVELIRRFLPAEPLFVAGDADTDYEMLTEFPGLELRLLINRNRRGDIRSLYGRALETERSKPLTLLQGRDENRGVFHPLQQTTPLGATEPLSLTELR